MHADPLRKSAFSSEKESEIREAQRTTAAYIHTHAVFLPHCAPRILNSWPALNI